MIDQADLEGTTQLEQHDETEQEADATGETPEVKADSEAESGGDEGEVTVTFGEEAPTSDDAEQHNAAPEWVRELRKADREKARRIRELEQKLTEQSAPAKVLEMPKPTLADCDYDEEVFEQKLDTWKTQQQAVKAEKEAKQAEERKAQEEWANTQAAYADAKKTLKLANFEEAEDAVKSELSEVQQALLLTALDSAENVAKLVAALGGNPAELKRIAAIRNPIKFAAAAAKLEEKMKVLPRKSAPPPERSPKGSTTAVGVTDTILARLEAEAAATGDRSKVVAHKRQLAAKQAKN